MEKLLEFVYEHLNQCYGFKDLYRAKEKYSPTVWEPSYYAYPVSYTHLDVYKRQIMENRTVSEEEAKETAKIVGLAALKYGDLSNQASKDYIFDTDRFISFEGNTGPYILYTIVRIKMCIRDSMCTGGFLRYW